jgi:hypothetical protein
MSRLGGVAADANLGIFSVLRGLFRRSGSAARPVSLADIRPREASQLPIAHPSADEEQLMRAAYDEVAKILRKAKGRPLTVDEVREAVRHTNPTNKKSLNISEVHGNCSECTMAVDDILAGRPAVAGKIDQLPQEDDIFRIFGRPGENIPLRIPGTYGEVERELLDLGPGARGVFMGRTTPLAGDTPHVGNVANIGGEVYYIDGQGQVVEKFTTAAEKYFRYGAFVRTG